MSDSLCNPRLAVAVLCGGDSAEREISLASGIQVAAALEEAGHHVRSIDPSEVALLDVDWRAFDVCYIALHGGAGEDGRVQAELESLGLAYTGSGPAACKLAMSKQAAKERLIDSDIPTPSFVALEQTEPFHETMNRVARLGLPVVIKPDSQGSSLGIGVATNEDQVQCCIAESAIYDSSILVETYLPGREFTVAVIDREPLPLLEILSNQAIFTYDGKYLDRSTEYVFDTNLSEWQTTQIQQLAVSAAEALHTSGLVRVDIRCDDALRPFVLELNTSPGMTEQSLVPRAALRAGLTMATLCDRLLKGCLAEKISE